MNQGITSFELPAEQVWLRPGEAARYLGVATQTIRNWVWLRKIPFVRRGRVVRFNRQDLDDWLRGVENVQDLAVSTQRQEFAGNAEKTRAR